MSVRPHANHPPERPSETWEASVIIPTYRGEQRLKPLLDALSAQDFTGRWETIISIDGESQKTREVVAPYEDRLNIRILASSTPRGVTYALNDGFNTARGRVLIRCDDDLTPAPSMVSGHVAAHKGRKLMGINCVYHDIEVATRFSEVYGSQAAVNRREQWYGRPAADRWIDWAGHNSITKETWDRLNTGFDTRFRYGQDSELGWRLTQLGVAIEVPYELEIQHRGAPTKAVNRIPRAYITGASRKKFMEVHGMSHRAAEGANSSRTSLWNLLTIATSYCFRSRDSYAIVGNVVERAIVVLPKSVARKSVAWALESAALAGERYGPNDLDDLAGQKDREIVAEETVSPKQINP